MKIGHVRLFKIKELLALIQNLSRQANYVFALKALLIISLKRRFTTPV
jgi:hypothetical protein